MQPLTFPIPFAKLSGTGNDFIIIDHRQPFIAAEDQAEFARRVCRRMFSVGADGLILIENTASEDFAWKFYNGDGSVAEMCGNGARCAARFAFLNKIAPAVMRFQTQAGVIAAEVLPGGEVKIKLTPPAAVKFGQPLYFGGEEREVHSLNTGVPHVVYLVPEANAVPVVEWGRTVRHHPHFQPAGTNVNFVQVLGADQLLVRTYERGVEDETMACGTGAVAAAIVALKQGLVTSPVRVVTSGGEHLRIHLAAAAPGGAISEVYLEGAAKLIYNGQLSAEALR